MIVVSNTTPILSLYKIDQLRLLEDLFGQVIVPKAVYDEIAVLGKGKPGHDVFGTAKHICVKEIQNTLAVSLLRLQLDYGEAEAIVLAIELGADILLLDEKKARRVAKANAQLVSGTVGVLQAAKDKGIMGSTYRTCVVIVPAAFVYALKATCQRLCRVCKGSAAVFTTQDTCKQANLAVSLVL